jgi:tetratricopeptide (TPR) repeat protein
MMSPDGIAPLLHHLRIQSGRRHKDIAEEIAEFMGEECEIQNPKRWESGRRIPTPRYRDAIAHVYGVPRREVDRAVEATKRAERLSKIQQLDGAETDVDRRTFLGAAALAAGAAAEPWGRLAAALGGADVDAETVQALEQTTAGMFESEEHIPAALMVDKLAAHLDTITALLPRAGKYRAALAIAAGEAAALAGWMAYDLGDRRQAAQYYGVAVQAGQAAGHGAVTALALGYGSYAVPAPRAREMLSEAQRQVRGPGYATASAWLAAREAEEAARLGDREGAVRCLERAHTAFEYANPAAEQAWVRFFRRARLGSMAIYTYSQIGHPELGAAVVDALAALGDDEAKIRCSVLGDGALGWLAVGDVDQAVEVGGRALAATVEDDTTMGRTRLAALAQQLPDSTAAAIELRERIRAAVPD